MSASATDIWYVAFAINNSLWDFSVMAFELFDQSHTGTLICQKKCNICKKKLCSDFCMAHLYVLQINIHVTSGQCIYLLRECEAVAFCGYCLLNNIGL